MFLFESVQLCGIIGTAVVVTSIGLWLLKRYGRRSPAGRSPSSSSRCTAETWSAGCSSVQGGRSRNVPGADPREHREGSFTRWPHWPER
jgi:hypothetical protein